MIKAKGGIDLLAAAEYIPYIGPVLRKLGYVKIGIEWASKKLGA